MARGSIIQADEHWRMMEIPEGLEETDCER